MPDHGHFLTGASTAPERRTATKSSLAAMSGAIEQLALAAGSGATVVALFQRAAYLEPVLHTYAALAEAGATIVTAYAGEGPTVPGAVHVVLSGDEPVADEWAVVLFAPAATAYVVGRDRRELARFGRTLEARRTFDATWGFDRVGAVSQARRLLKEFGGRLHGTPADAVANAVTMAETRPNHPKEQVIRSTVLALAAALETRRALVADQFGLAPETQASWRDALTGLSNRPGLARWLGGAAADGLAMPLIGSVMIDLDQFASVNERHGRTLGDKLLTAVAVVLGEATRAGDVVARWDGDRFVVLCPGSEGAKLLRIGLRLVTLIPTASADDVFVTASAVVQSHRRRPLKLDEAAPAMRVAKDAGGNRAIAVG